MSLSPLAVPLPPLPFRLVTKGTPYEDGVRCHWVKGRVGQKRRRWHLICPSYGVPKTPGKHTVAGDRKAGSQSPATRPLWSAATVSAAPYAKDIDGSRDRFPSPEQRRGMVSTRSDFSNYLQKAVGIFSSVCLQASLSGEKKMIFLNALANPMAQRRSLTGRSAISCPVSALESPVPWQREKTL